MREGLRGFRQGPIQPGCTVTVDGKILEISNLNGRGINYLCSEHKEADQLSSYRAVDLRLCFAHPKIGYLMMRLI